MPPIKKITASSQVPFSQMYPQTESGIRLGINPFDLERIPQIVKTGILSGKIDLKSVIRLDKDREDEGVVVFTCPLLVGALIIDNIRNQQRLIKDVPIRAYIFRRTWSRIPSTVVLTNVDKESGRPLLSEEFFKPRDGQEEISIDATELSPMAPERI